VGPKKVGWGWFHWSFVVVVIEEVMGKGVKCTRARKGSTLNGSLASNVLVKEELDLLG
jgi:hypothetical protein